MDEYNDNDMRDWKDHQDTDNNDLDYDSDDDIVWEDEQVDQDVTTDNPNSSSLTKELSEADFTKKRKSVNSPGTKKKVRLIFDKSDTSTVVLRHKNDVFAGILHGFFCSKACDEVSLQAAMQSLLPLEHHILNPKRTSLSSIHAIINWFHLTFVFLDDDSVSIDEGLQGSNESFLTSNVLAKKGGSAQQLNQLFVALLRSFGIHVRYVISLTPCSLRPNDHEDIKNNRQSKLEQKSANVVIIDDDSNSGTFFNSHIVQSSWCEVLITSVTDHMNASSSSVTSGHWVYINIRRMQVLYPILHSTTKLSLRPIKNSTIVVLGFESDGYLIDLTLRYWSKYYMILPLLKKFNLNLWLESLVTRTVSKLYRQPVDLTESETCQFSYDKEFLYSIRLQEVNDIKRIAMTGNDIVTSLTSSEDLIGNQVISVDTSEITYEKPKTFLEFKNHPKYLLERDLKANEIIHPNFRKSGICMIFRGESVYDVKYREELRTKIQWLKLLKQIKPEEINSPVKINIVSRHEPVIHGNYNVYSNKVSSSSSSNENSEKMQVKLYGSWQTQDYVVPTVVDDKIPVNEYGNAEIWDGNSNLIPKGCSLITTRNASNAAKFLGIDYVNAIFGWESNNGHRVPKIGGILVLSRYQDSVIDVAETIFYEKQIQLEEKHELSVIRNWEKIVRKLLTRNELREKYGH